MTDLLSKTFEKTSWLPENLQDELAEALPDELAWETRWDQTRGKFSDIIDEMAEEALDEYPRNTGRKSVLCPRNTHLGG